MSIDKDMKKNKAINLAQMAYVESQRKRMKPTNERIDDLKKMYAVMRFFAVNHVVIHHFMSTDTKPVIYVEPDAEFKRSILGKAVIIDSRTPHQNEYGKIVNIECHADFNGVDVRWCEVEFNMNKRSDS